MIQKKALAERGPFIVIACAFYRRTGERLYSERDFIIEIIEAARGRRTEVVVLGIVLLGGLLATEVVALLRGRLLTTELTALLRGRLLTTELATLLRGRLLATELATLLRRCGRLLAALLRRLLRATTSEVATATFTTRIQHLHVVGHDFRAVTVIAVLTLPLARLQAAFDIQA